MSGVYVSLVSKSCSWCLAVTVNPLRNFSPLACQLAQEPTVNAGTLDPLSRLRPSCLTPFSLYRRSNELDSSTIM